MEGVTQEQVDGITQMLTSILSIDNEVRKLKEAEFTALRKSHPASVVVCLIVVLRNCPEARVRGLAAVLIRQTVTLFTAEDRNTWKELTEQQKVYIKENVIQAAQLEAEKAVRNRIADTLGEITGTIMRNGEVWPEIFQYVVQAGQSDQPAQVALALKITNGLCIYATKQLVSCNEQLHGIFAAALASPHGEVQENAVEALCNFLTAVDSIKTTPFGTLLTPLLQAVTAIITRDPTTGKESLEFLTYVADAEYKYFKNDMATVFAFVSNICWMTDLDDLGPKYLALEFYITILSASTAHLLTDTETFNKLVDCVFKMMLEVDVEVDDSWNNPAEGFEDKDDDEIEIDYVKLGNKMLTRLLGNTAIEGGLTYILSLVQKTLANAEDWRMKYTALMTLGEMAGRINETAKVAELVTIIGQHLDTGFHAKIRYAAYGCVASLCEEKEEVFQAAYHEQVVAMIQTGFSDPIPRVQSQVLYLTSSFFEGAVKTLAVQYAPVFIPKLIEVIGGTNCSIVKEYALTALATLAGAAKDNFAQYYTQVVPILTQLITNYVDPIYKQLRGRCIECLSLVATSIGREQFAGCAGEITTLLYQIQNSLEEQKDPQTEFILSAWSKIAMTMKEDFAPYLANVLPGLFKLADLSGEMTLTTADTDVQLDIQALAGETLKKPKISVTTLALETKCVAMRCIKTIIEHCGGAFAPFSETAMPLLVSGVQFRINENIRSYASEAIGCMIESEVKSNKPEAVQSAIVLSKNFLGIIWTAIDAEFETNTKVTHLDTVKTIIEAIPTPFLTQEEVDEMGRRVVNLIKKTLEDRAKLAANKEQKGEDDTDSEGDDEFYEEMVKSEEDSLHTAVSELLGAIFKTHKQESLPFVQFFFTEMMTPFLDPNANYIDHKFAIFVIDDIIEFLGESLAITQWPYLADAIMKHALSPDEVVRQASVYGIGVLAGASSKEFFVQIAVQCVDLLQQAAQMQGLDIEQVGHARDNAVASMAKILKHQAEAVSIETTLAAIIPYLPLRYDKHEARFAHDFLADLCTLRPDLIAPHGERVIKIFAELLETKFMTEETTTKVKAFFAGLQANGQLTGEGLTEMMKGKIQACLNSN